MRKPNLFAILLLCAQSTFGTDDFINTNTSSPQKVPRWDGSKLADDDTFHKAMCLGARFLSAMEVSDEQAGKIFQSTANPPTMRSSLKGDKHELDIWGWTVSDPTTGSSMCDYDGTWHLKKPFDALKLDTKSKADGGGNLCYDIRHGDETSTPLTQQKYNVEGREYTKTGGRCQIAVNHADGAIIAQGRLSPSNAAEKNWHRKPSIDELPALRTMTDILWGAWARDNDNVKNFKYFWAQRVSNDKTKGIIATALKNANSKLEPWPGTTFNMISEDGKALLGSPNAVPFASFLLSHKEELGNKMIVKAMVFLGTEDDKAPIEDKNPELVFAVEDVPDPMLQLCSRQCCRGESRSRPQEDPPTSSVNTRDFEKRTLLSPQDSSFGSVWNFVRDICSRYSLLVDLDNAAGAQTAFVQSYWRNAGNRVCLASLYGCTGVVVVSRRRVWIAHIVENPTAKNPGLWQYNALGPLQYGGGGSEIPSGQGLSSLVQQGDFAPGQYPQAFIITPKTRRARITDPQPETIAYPELVSTLQSTVGNILNVQVQVHTYVANGATSYFLNQGITPMSHPGIDMQDGTPAFQTPYGKLVVNYDNNLYNFPRDTQRPRGDQRWAGYDLWLADNPQPLARDVWPAYQDQ